MGVGDGQEPIFVFDSREEFKPLGVKSIEALGAGLFDSNGNWSSPLSLNDLPAEGGRMDLPPEPQSYEKEMQGEFGNIGYRRTVRGGSLTWVQYWLWYLYNPKKVVVTGNHEGDWEFVQVGYAGAQPICVTASQHRSGGARMWWEVEVDEGRPVIYVARGSHANYFAPVDGLPEVGDDGDGAGDRLDTVRWRRFESWASWPGRWGNSTGQGTSPESPGNQGARWTEPHRYHSEAHHQPPTGPDSKQPLRLTHGNTARTRARGRRARRVFHGTLAAELNDRGAATVDELYLRFDCFLLPLEKPEIRQVLESARREGIVTEVSDERDGYGGEVSEQWTTTEKGRKLSRPRTLALPDLGYLIVGEHDRTVKAFDLGKTLLTMAIPVLALFGIDRLDPGVAARWAIYAGVGVAIAWMVGYALKGELDLRAAAASWPRLRTVRQRRWEYQRSWPCMAYLPALIAVVYAAVGLWIGLGFFPWWAYASAAIVAVLAYLLVVYPKYRAWHRTDPDRCRREWVRRGNEAKLAPRFAQGTS